MFSMVNNMPHEREPYPFDQDWLINTLDYDEDTGVFRWKKARGRVPAGAVAGYWNEYRQHLTITLFTRKIKAHRLAWFYVYGYWPEEVDHVDGDRLNNAIANLRDVTKCENMRNQGYRKNRQPGTLGVSHTGKGKWRAYITVNGAFKHLGTFDTPEAAAKAREDANVKYGYHANHGKRIATTGNTNARA